MGLALALAAAVSWGASDFIAGRAERASPGMSVVVGSQLVGLLAVLALLPVVGGHAGDGALWSGAAAGLGSAIGLALLYHALAVGRMSVTAPITGAVAAAIPVLFGLLTGERPSPLALVGVAVALGAIVILSAAPSDGEATSPQAVAAVTVTPVVRDGLLSQPGVLAALVSGLGFGAYFILLGRTGDDAGLWAVFAAKLSSLVVLGSVAAAASRAVTPAPGTRRGVLAVGVLDVAANVFFLLASRQSLLSLVALVTSLYPAVTVLLARAVLGERLTRLQVLSVATAGAGVALIVLG